MKRILSLSFVFVCVLSLLSPVAAHASEYGVYVAPRVAYGFSDFGTLTFDTPFTNNWNGTGSSASKSSVHDDTVGGVLAVGVNLKPTLNVPVRAELEYSFFKPMQAQAKKSGPDPSPMFPGDINYDSVKQTVEVQTLFFNAYYDIDTGTRFTPFVTAGVGVAFARVGTNYELGYYRGGNVYFDSVNSNKKRSTNFAWNVGAGLGIELAQDLTLDFMYRFADLGKVESYGANSQYGYQSSKVDHLYMHQVMMGVRLEF